MGRNNLTTIAVAAMGLVLCTALHAESSFVDTMSGATVLQNGGNPGGTNPTGAGGSTWSGANSLAKSTASGSMVNPNTISDNSATNAVSGREIKAGDGQNQGNAGKAAAIVAGTGMVVAAIPLLASLDPVEVAAGASLMAMSGLEFAQAGASGSAANDNKAQKNLLKAKVDDGEQAQPASAEIKDQLSNNKQLNDLLQSRGINADDFTSKLANGDITNAQQALAAVGNKTDISPDQLAAGQQVANSQAGDITGKPEPLGNPNNMRVINDDSAKSRPMADDGKNGDGNGGGGVARDANPAKGGGAGAGGLADGPKNTVGGGAKDAGLTPAMAAALGGKPATGAGFGFGGDTMSSIMSALGITTAASPAAKRAIAEQALQRMGILTLNKKQNIFQLAHRNYRSFQKWRKQTKVAHVAHQ